MVCAQVQAEERVAVPELVEQLEHLDAALQLLEHEGRALEENIRLGKSSRCHILQF